LTVYCLKWRRAAILI